MAETAGHDLEGVRSELRRLGYLNHSFERFLLQDALRPRQAGRTVALLTLKVGLLAGLVAALALALALVIANALPGTRAVDFVLDTLALFLHLFPPLSAVAALGFLALCGVLLLVLRLYHVRRIETLSLVAALLAGGLALVLALRAARVLLGEGNVPLAALLGLGAPIAVYALVKLVDDGLLALAIRFTDAPPAGRLFSRRWLGLAIVAAAFLLTLPAVLSARGEPAIPPPSTFPTAQGERVLLVGIDGVLPEEVDYLIAVGDLPTLASLSNAGGRLWSYPRRDEVPASFWTSVATGVPGPGHGVAALDSFRPLGVRTSLARTGPLRAWWNRVAVPLGLVEYRPVLANRRSAFMLWEFASRGGAPVLAVNWWATFPAEPLPGLVVAHGAYQLLQEGAKGAVAPETAWEPVRRLAREAARPVGDGVEGRLRAALPGEAAASVLERALRPDRFYRQVFESRITGAPRAAALYLPGLDIAADGWAGGDVAFADLVRSELRAADLLLGRTVPGGIGTVAVVLDPGRRRVGGEGRILLWRRGMGCGRAAAAQRPSTTPEAVAAALLRALGLPQSGELPPPPPECVWPAPPVVLAGYGERGASTSRAAEGKEYLESLRSLGYL